MSYNRVKVAAAVSVIIGGFAVGWSIYFYYLIRLLSRGVIP